MIFLLVQVEAEFQTYEPHSTAHRSTKLCRTKTNSYAIKISDPKTFDFSDAFANAKAFCFSHESPNSRTYT